MTIQKKNTFKFTRFSERLEEIDIDVFHKLPHRYEVQSEEKETHFYEAMQKWNTCDLTENYKQFRHEVRGIITLPQLLNQKQHVMDTLMKYIKMKDLLCLQAILEILVAVARDLQKDFYEYFPPILQLLFKLLELKEVHRLEDKENIIKHTFTSLAYLFKFLWRYMVKDIKTIFALLLPLLSDSNPTYMRLFAADSFKFVVRKLKDKHSFTSYIFKTLEKHSDGISGCGALLFEVIAGVHGQFHSCAANVLNLYFNSLNDENLDQQIVNDVLTQVIYHTTKSISANKSDILSVSFENMIIQFKKISEKKANLKKHPLIYLLGLLNIVVKYRGGIMLKQKEQIIENILNILNDFAENDELTAESVNILTEILLATNVSLADGTPYLMICKVLSAGDKNLQLKTIERLIHYPAFELHILNQLLRNVEFDSCVLRLYAKIVIEKRKPIFRSTDSDWTKYNLPIDLKNNKTSEFLLQKLKMLNEDEIPIDTVRLLIILPHLHTFPEDFKAQLRTGLSSLYEKLKIKETKEKQNRQLSFVFLLTIHALSYMIKPDDFIEFVKSCKIDFIELVQINVHNVCILNSFDLYLKSISKSNLSWTFINLENFDKIARFLAVQLSSPNPRIRSTVVNIFYFFAFVEGICICSDEKKKNAFVLLQMAENVPVGVNTYRDRLLYLRELEFQSQSIIDLDPKFNEIPLRFLIGNFYLNFSLIWEPVSEIVATYASKRCAQFWPVFYSELTNEKSVEQIDTNLYDCDVLTTIATETLAHSENVDFQNYKLLLWKCMSRFAEYAESKTRDISPIFIDFVKKQFSKSTSVEIKSCNIENSLRKENKEEEEEDDDDDDENEDEEMEEEKKSAKSVPLMSAASRTNLLLAQLHFFSKCVNPRMAYQEPELNQIYLDLLSSRKSEVQKAALNCLFNYKHKYLTPYKENLLNLFDEKKLKTELTRFHIDSENKIVLDEHRAGLIPIIMRIIYAKMTMRVGLRTGGKGGGLLRRKMILRYLAGSRESELLIFADMAFKPFQKYVNFSTNFSEDPRDIVNRAINNIDLSKVIHPKKLQSSVNLISIFFDEFGAKMCTKRAEQWQIMPKLLTLLLCILAEAAGMLEMADRIYVGYLGLIRSLRTSCIGVLARFFSHFEDYEWTEAEVDALFEVAVFPWLQKLPIEGIHSPTALLKMFTIWGSTPRYFPLLIKHKEGNENLSPLPYIIKLLLNKNTAPSVVNAIMQMFEKMLTLEDYKVTEDMEVDGMEAPSMMQIVSHKKSISSDLKANINFGSAILLPHVLDILHFMKTKLKKSRNLNKTDLVILSRVSELTADPTICDSLLELLIPVTIKKAARDNSEDATLELMTSMVNLTKNVTHAQKHLRFIIPLLSILTAIPARKLLLNLFEIIASKSAAEKLVRDARVILNLNAFDERWIDQPDFQRRLDAFDQVRSLIEADDLSLELGAAVIHNCFLFLQADSDLAIRDASTQCLKSVGVKMANVYQNSVADRKYLIEDTILTLVRKGIRSKKEAVYFASVTFLGHMAMECPDVHPVLRDLSLLSNKRDPEVDFFENLVHLQTHRKGRALLKFCSVAETLHKAPNPKTLTQFILPLASSFLCNEDYAKKNSLIDSAIKTVAAVCRLLPWHYYQIILKFYLDKLRFLDQQKQTVRIVVAILDAFHYDLSKSDESVKIEVKTKDEEDTKINKEDKKIEEVDNKKDEEDKMEEEEEENDEEKMVQILQKTLPEEEEEEEEVKMEEGKEVTKVLVMQKLTVLSAQMANRLVCTISKSLLPQLDRAIIARTQYEKTHKVNRKSKDAKWSKEEEELMRVPVALAVVKLLQKLPQKLLNLHLPGIFMKLCSFLKSDMESVRKTTREILQNIMTTLGPDYLHYLLREMNTLLTKGFQVHVLGFTTHAVLQTLKPYFNPDHIKNNLQSILSVCRIDIFGQTAEEKEISAITRKLSEAKSTKSYDIFNILAEYIDASCMIDLLMPIKDVLLKTNSHKTMEKINRCLKQVALGLSVNKFIAPDQMLMFLYGVVSESIPYLLPEKKTETSSEKSKVKPVEKLDCFLIPAEPKNRMGEKVTAKTSKNTNVHSLVEFGLRLLELLLNKNQKEHNAVCKDEYKVLLDPFVPILNNCLKSKHVKLNTTAMRCLKTLLSQAKTTENEELDLSSITELLPEIVASIFEILHKYAVANLSKGDNAVLVSSCFKTMSTIMSTCAKFKMSDDQLQSLLLYIEQDLHDSEKFATAFELLKRIIKRKYKHDEIPNLIQKVRELSIVSESESIRQQSRNVFYAYLKTYFLANEHLGKNNLNKIKAHLAFYCQQLNYELKPGRMSALLMIQTMINKFPEKIMSFKVDKKDDSIYGYLFLILSAALVNDKDPSFCKHCATCIKELILRLKHNERTILFNLVITLMKDKKLEHRLMATQTCGIFVNAEKEKFESRLLELLPVLMKQFQKTEDSKIGSHIKDVDRLRCHHKFQLLQLILKISNYCNNFFVKSEFSQYIDYFAEQSQDLLNNEHLWVRLAASQFLGFCLASIDEQKFEILLDNLDDIPDTGFIYSNPLHALKSLSLDLINQLHPELEFEEFSVQVIKNLICIAKLIKTIKPKIASKAEHVQNNENENTMDNNDISLMWLVRKIRRAVNAEITQAPGSTVVRTSMFKWTAGVVSTISIDYLKPILFHMMGPLAREMSTTEETNAPLRQLAKEVSTIIKKTVGVDEYTRLLSKAQQRLDIRRAERKKVRSQQVVTNPEVAAKRKIAKQQRKRESKKRKMEIVKGKGLPRKKFKKALKVEDE